MLKEVLCREEVTVSFNSVRAVLEAAVPDTSVCARLISWLQELRVEQSDDGAPSETLHMDDILEVAMLMWDEQEAKLAPQIEQMLQARLATG